MNKNDEYLDNLESEISDLNEMIKSLKDSIIRLNRFESLKDAIIRFNVVVGELEEKRDELKDELKECTPSDGDHYDDPDYASEVHGNWGRGDY